MKVRRTAIGSGIKTEGDGGAQRREPLAWLPWVLLAISAVLFALHFVHLRADFPNDSPWMDWSKYTDEGWYGDAAIRHIDSGHWYWPGDFNPAVALPVWPLLEWPVFRVFGANPVAARSLTLGIFGLTLFGLWRLLGRFAGLPERTVPLRWAPALLVLFLCASPYLFVFERMAILEPLLVTFMTAALLTATRLEPLRRQALPRTLWPPLLLGILLLALVLTKTTAVALIPAVLYFVWARQQYRLWATLRLIALPLGTAVALWLAYFLLLVRPRYLEDYQYLFSANAYTGGFFLDPIATVVSKSVADGSWMGLTIYAAFFVLLAAAAFLRPGFFHSPLVGALLLWIAGYFAFLIYHYNLQPRYYLVVAVPITAVVALALDEAVVTFRSRKVRWGMAAAVAVTVLAITGPDLAMQIGFLRNPSYDFETAAKSIAAIVRADKTRNPLLLSISGSDITLMTGLPSIDDDFGTLDLDQRVKRYKPGWYAAWNELDDDKMDALAGYKATRVAEFPAMDDPERNLLILYALDPEAGEGVKPPTKKGKRPPKGLRTKMGQQPDTQQLEH